MDGRTVGPWSELVRIFGTSPVVHGEDTVYQTKKNNLKIYVDPSPSIVKIHLKYSERYVKVKKYSLTIKTVIDNSQNYVLCNAM